jgi:sec-independent protein translocase protein TatA
MNAPIAWIPQGPEWIAIILVALLLFGAKKLPELARSLGKVKGEFKKAQDEFEREIKHSEAEALNEEEDVKIKEVAGKEPREV